MCSIHLVTWRSNSLPLLLLPRSPSFQELAESEGAVAGLRRYLHHPQPFKVWGEAHREWLRNPRGVEGEVPTC